MMLQPVLIRYIHNVLYRSGRWSILVLDETFDTSYYSYVFPLFSPFFETFDGKIGDMISAGLFKHWIDIQVDPKGFQRIEEEEKPQVLTIDHFSICFEIWLISLSASVFTYVLEFVVFSCKIMFESWISTYIIATFNNGRLGEI